MAQQTGRHHHRYDRRTWMRRAKLQLREYPLCAMCLERKVTTPATVADHITPHKGSQALFWDSEHNWQPLCTPCHNAKTAGEEMQHWKP